MSNDRDQWEREREREDADAGRRGVCGTKA
jgi:hypothetical protein